MAQTKIEVLLDKISKTSSRKKIESVDIIDVPTHILHHSFPFIPQKHTAQ